MNTASKTDPCMLAALRSDGFRDELRKFMVECNVTPEDFSEFRFAKGAKTGSDTLVLELNEGRQRAFPFAMHTTH